jgi:acetyltransferase-like isoleucine patch superfamily enzyme
MVSSQALLFGETFLGSQVVVEPFAVVGHPIQDRVAGADFDEVVSLESLFVSSAGVVRIGDGAIVRSGAVLYADVVLGKFSEVGHHVVVREGVSVGDYSRILPHTSIRKNAKIGKGCRLACVVVDSSVLEDYVTCLGQLVHDYSAGVSGHVEAAPTLRTGCVVGRLAAVVGGVTVGEFAFVGAGAMVQRDVAPFAVVAGNPARQVGVRRQDELDRVRQRIEEGRFL